MLETKELIGYGVLAASFIVGLVIIYICVVMGKKILNKFDNKKRLFKK